ncbi:unnamed protein product [Moneuplotes crassus]|uniref:Uncharacterized protein n=1 Tax=Euplotes crassus TaxID=5936 RepID=A0AAD1XW17_EUPCR|nr:unnamed protein product [Moneuplotes crassus]
MELLIQAWLYEKKLFFGLPYVSRFFVENFMLMPAIFNLVIAFCALYYCNVVHRTLYDFIKAYGSYFLLSCSSALLCISMVVQTKFAVKIKKDKGERKIYEKPSYSEYIMKKNYEHSDFFWLRWRYTRSFLALISFLVFLIFNIWGVFHRNIQSMPIKWRGSFSGRLIEFHTLILNLSTFILTISLCTIILIRLSSLIIFMKFPKIALCLCFCGKKRTSRN